MRLYSLIQQTGLECPQNIENIEISNIVTSSDKVTKNCIFVCIRGSVYDGHDYIDEAIKAGAAVIVAEKVRGKCVGGAATILVEDTRHYASLLYNVWFGNPVKDLKIIGVTGTNGKTSVSCMLLEIFERAGYSCGLVGTLGIFSANRRPINIQSDEVANMTTPPPEQLYRALAQMRNDGVEYVFMEVSSHALAQCRTDAIEFEASIFTNLTEDHLDFHNSMEEYYRAKRKLFTQSRLAIVNSDDEVGRRLFRSLEEEGKIFKTCSLTDGDFCALDTVAKGTKGIEYALKTHEGRHRVILHLCGSFQVLNSLEAIALAECLGIPVQVAIDALSQINGIGGRMERVVAHERQDFDIFIDYAHTPDALEKLLLTVRKFRKDKSRIILLFGCGGDREREKRKAMGQIASRFSDTVIITSDNSRGEDPRAIISEILKGIDKEKQYVVIEDRREAIERAVTEYAKEGDILLLAGKGHETYQIDANGKHPFDERKIVREALKKLYC